MFSLSDRAMARQILDTANSVQAALPATVTRDYERALALSAAATSLNQTGERLTLAIVTAVEDGRDPATDPDVQRHLAARQLDNEGTVMALDSFGYDRFRDTCTANVEQIVKAWRKPYDRAAAALAEAFANLGPIPLEDTATIVARGGSAASEWTTAQTASRTITTITGAWLALCGLTRLAQTDPRYGLLRLADVTPEQWDREELTFAKLSPWAAVCAGLTPSLPTPGEYRIRVQRLEQGLAALAAESTDLVRWDGMPLNAA